MSSFRTFHAGVIDLHELLAAFENGTMTGAAPYEFNPEPQPPDSAFWSVPNLLVSPHCSWVLDGRADASFDLFLTYLARWRGGQELLNIVDPVRGY